MLAQILATLLSTLFAATVHYYVWRRLVRDPHWSPRGRRIATRVLVIMFVLLTTTVWMLRLGVRGSVKVNGWVVMPWMVAISLTALWRGAIGASLGAVAATGATLRRALGRRAPGQRAEPSDGARELASDSARELPSEAPAPPFAPTDRLDDPGRRIFLARAAAGTALVASTASVSAGMREARGIHELVTVEVPLPRLPRALDGFSIVQLTDLHVGITIGHEFVRQVVDRANAARPDLIALTGDLMDGTVEDLREDIAPFADLRARHGVYAVTGNHEYYSGVDAWIAELTRLGVTYLRNQRVEIGTGNDRFELAGIDDHSAHRWAGHGADLAAAVRGRDATRALVLLAHQPRQVRDAVLHDVDLQLSGHTHGGQIWPWHYVARVQQGGLLSGMYRRGNTQLYVSRGCGYFGPPIRLGAPLEITKIVLRAA